MGDFVDPVQRHIHTIAVRDAIVPDDASHLKLPATVPPKQFARLQRAMLQDVDFPGAGNSALLEDPVGRRVGRVAFARPLQALRIDGRWTGPGPAPHRLPDDAATIAAFIREQTRLTDGTIEGDGRVQHLLGFSITDHARVTDLLRTGGAGSRLLIADSMLSAACVTYEKARQRTAATGRGGPEAGHAAAVVEAALIGTARIATGVVLNDGAAPHGIRRIAAHLADQVEAVRRNRPCGKATRSVRIAAAAADAVHLWLTRGILHDLPLNHERDPARLSRRLAVGNGEMAAMVDAMIEGVPAELRLCRWPRLVRRGRAARHDRHRHGRSSVSRRWRHARQRHPRSGHCAPPRRPARQWRIRPHQGALVRSAPSIASRLEMSSCLKADAATCKGLVNRATAFAGRFDDLDHHRPAGIGFDYVLWFHRDRDVPFWDRLQKGAKLYGAFSQGFVPDAVEPEPLPDRRGRRAIPPGTPPSRWQRIMAKAKTAFDAYWPLYLRSRPSALTARIMARMSEGYSAFASDPQFRTIFRY